MMRARATWIGCVGLMFALTGCEGAFDEGDAGVEAVEIDSELTTIQRAWATGSFDGDLGIRASWSGGADMDLFVRTPAGDVYSYQRTSGADGGRFTKNACQASACRSQTSEEVSWLGGAPTGTYQIWVERYDTRPVEDLVIEVSRAGAIEQTFVVEGLAVERGATSQTFEVDVEELPVESRFNGPFGVQLSWSGGADLDLFVETPRGERLFYGNLRDGLGGRFTKGECMLTRCDHTSSEEVRWDGEAPSGTFRVRVVNYNGGVARDVTLRVHSRRQIIEEQRVDVPASRRAEALVTEVEHDERALAPAGLELSSHEDEQWVMGEDVALEIERSDASIALVELVVNGRAVAEFDGGQAMRHTHRFAQLGQQSIELLGYDGDGQLKTLTRRTLVVTDANGGLPPRGAGARDVSRQLLAKRILELDGIYLYETLPSGRVESRPADSLSNMRDAVFGTSRTSCYGNGTCANVYLDERLLQAMVMINQLHGYDYRVTTIAGGSHSRSSRHYSGIALDVNYINGTKVSYSSRSLNREFTRLCRDYGATEILQPPDRGHSGHIHCAWPR